MPESIRSLFLLELAKYSETVDDILAYGMSSSELDKTAWPVNNPIVIAWTKETIYTLDSACKMLRVSRNPTPQLEHPPPVYC